MKELSGHTYIEGQFHENAPFSDEIKVGVEHNNLLLLNIISDYYKSHNLRLPSIFQEEQRRLQEQASRGELLTWISTEDVDHEPQEVAIAKITDQTEKVSKGELMMCYVVVPVLNEASNIPNLVASIKNQKTTMPLSVVIVDNGSTDNSEEVAKRLGCNVVGETRRGIGPARQKGIDTVLAYNHTSPENTLVLQTDADCTIDTANFIEDVAKQYLTDPKLMATVGPTKYDIPLDTGEHVTLSTGRDFGVMFGTRGLHRYFEEYGRAPQDYLLSAPYYFMIGPNTAYRGTVFSNLSISYPKDHSWESIDISIRLQMAIDASTQIQYIPSQIIASSSRAVVKDIGVLTRERLEKIQAKGFIEPYKTGNNFKSPSRTVKEVVDDIDKRVYNLAEDEELALIIEGANPDAVELKTSGARIEPQFHAATKAKMEKRAVIIEKLR
jgi:glycosyltransferase involved in cell wall biosynthesis